MDLKYQGRSLPYDLLRKKGVWLDPFTIMLEFRAKLHVMPEVGDLKTRDQDITLSGY